MNLKSRIANLERQSLSDMAELPPYVHHRIVVPTPEGLKELVPTHHNVSLFDGRTFTSKAGESIEDLVDRARGEDERPGLCYRVVDVVKGLKLPGADSAVTSPLRITHDMSPEESSRMYYEFILEA